MATIGATAKPDDRIVIDHDTVILNRVITPESVAPIIAKVLQSDKQNITLFIESPGGSVFAGIGLIQALKDSGKTFTCVVKEAASMAFIFVQSVCTDRVATPTSVFMQHQATYGVNPLPDEQVTNYLRFIQSMLAQLDKEQADRLGITVTELKEKTRSDWWLYGDEILANRAADRYAKVTCTPELTAEVYQEVEQVFFFTVTVEKSRCPLVGTLRTIPAEKQSDGINGRKVPQTENGPHR